MFSSSSCSPVDLMDTPCPTPAPSPCPTENPQDPQIYSIQLEDVDGPSTSTAVTSTAVQTSVKGKFTKLKDFNFMIRDK